MLFLLLFLLLWLMFWGVGVAVVARYVNLTCFVFVVKGVFVAE